MHCLGVGLLLSYKWPATHIRCHCFCRRKRFLTSVAARHVRFCIDRNIVFRTLLCACVCPCKFVLRFEFSNNLAFSHWPALFFFLSRCGRVLVKCSVDSRARRDRARIHLSWYLESMTRSTRSTPWLGGERGEAALPPKCPFFMFLSGCVSGAVL